MKIQSIEITNFRGFNGEHYLEFSTDEAKPVTLIVAENGTGKSNILEAIMWCLHGTLPPKKSKSEQTICVDSVLKNPRAQAKVMIKVIDDKTSLKTKNAYPEYTISRTLKKNDGPSELAVWEKDEGRQGGRVAIDRPLNLIEQLLPKSLSPYFLYSGEGINNLFEDKDEAGLKESIEHMQGLTFASQAVNYLSGYEAFLSTKMIKEEKASKAQLTAQNELKEVVDDLTFWSKKKSKSEDAKREADKRLREVNALLGKSDHEVIKHKTKENEELKKQISNDIKDKDRYIDLKRSIMGEAGFQVLSFELKSTLNQFIYKNKKEGNIPAKVHQQTLTNVLEKGICICGEKLNDKCREFINASFDDAGTESQSQHHAGIEALLKSFNLSNRQARKTYEQYDALIIEKEESISRKQSIFKTNLETIGSSQKDKTTDDLLKEKSSLENSLDGKISDDLFEATIKVRELSEKQKKLVKQAAGGSTVDPKIKFRMEFIRDSKEKLEELIDSIRENGRKDLEDKLIEISKKYNKKKEVINYRDENSYIPILKDSKGLARPQNDGSISQTAIYYTLGLVHVCKERFKDDKLLLKPGTIAPIIFDSPFSKLDPGNIGSVTKMIGEIPEQSVLILNSKSYDGDCRKVLKDNNRIGKAYYLQRKQLEEAPPELGTMQIGNSVYDAFVKDKVISNTICELKKY